MTLMVNSTNIELFVQVFRRSMQLSADSGNLCRVGYKANLANLGMRG